ncbi:hypothetical protein Tco_0265134, partial [Tanacetum coccineum]
VPIDVKKIIILTCGIVTKVSTIYRTDPLHIRRALLYMLDIDSYDKIMRQTFHIIGLFQITVETYRGVKAHLDVYYKDNSKWKLMGSSHSQRQRCGLQPSQRNIQKLTSHGD